MRGRDINFPCKNQELSISYKGKIYGICSPEQMAYLIMIARDRLMIEASQQGKALTEEELKIKLTEYEANCGHATLESVLGKMTPDEIEQWKASYRFAPVIRQFQK
jgi:hypothetical protein